MRGRPGTQASRPPAARSSASSISSPDVSFAHRMRAPDEVLIAAGGRGVKSKRGWNRWIGGSSIGQVPGVRSAQATAEFFGPMGVRFASARPLSGRRPAEAKRAKPNPLIQPSSRRSAVLSTRDDCAVTCPFLRTHVGDCPVIAMLRFRKLLRFQHLPPIRDGREHCAHGR